MFDLFKSEFKRYVLLALALMAAHLAVWGFVYTQKPLLEFGDNENFGTFLFCIATGLVFGVVQFAMHRLKNRWAWLVHRPMSLHQIHHSLLGAGATLLHIGVVLPFAIVLVLMDSLTNEVVEWRHYAFVLHMSLLTMIAYALGSYVALSANKGALASIGLIAFVEVDGAFPAYLLLGLEVLILLTLYWLSRWSFKVNLNEHFSEPKQIILAVLVMQPLLAGLVWFSQLLFYHLPVFMIYGPAEQIKQADYHDTLSMVYGVEPEVYVEEVLRQSDYADRESLVKQVALAHEGSFRTAIRPMPSRGQPFNLDKVHSLRDIDSGNRWVLSHNEMALQGLNLKGEKIGFLGARGFLAQNAELSDKDRFDSVPTLSHGYFIKTRDRLMMVDFAQSHISEKFRLPQGEQFIGELQFDNKIQLALLISNKATYTFDARQMREFDEAAAPLHRIEHHTPMVEQPFGAYFELVDGYLFAYYGPHYFGHNKPGTALVYARHDGTTEVIGEKAFIKVGPQPDVITYMDFWASPLVKGYFFSYIRGIFETHRNYRFVTADNINDRYYPQSVVIWAVLMSLFSALITLVLAIKIKLPRAKAMLWVGINLICGLAGLLAFLLMNSWWGFWHRTGRTNQAKAQAKTHNGAAQTAHNKT